MSSLLFPFVILFAFAGFWIGSRFERQKLQDPAVRLEIALQALRGGYEDAALRLLNPLAASGNATAQYWLADLYEHGLGVQRDGQKAVDILSKSAEKGFVPAETRLGEIYLNGRLVIQDLQLAREWLGKAAIGGDDSAQYQLSHIYERGLGAVPDTVEAYAWAAVAASRGNALAQRERNRILASLSAEQAAQGETRAKQLVGQIVSPSAGTNAVSTPAPQGKVESSAHASGP
jgi:TPR repeat protein